MYLFTQLANMIVSLLFFVFWGDVSEYMTPSKHQTEAEIFP